MTPIQASIPGEIAFGDYLRVSELLEAAQCNFTNLSPVMCARLRELGSVTELGKSIEILELHECALTSAQITELLQYFPRTRYFTCKSIQNRDLGLLKGFRELVSLTLTGCEEAISNKGLSSLKGLRLRHLELSSCTISEDLLKKFPLQMVWLQGKCITDEVIKRLLNEHESLESFNGVSIIDEAEDSDTEDGEPEPDSSAIVAASSLSAAQKADEATQDAPFSFKLDDATSAPVGAGGGGVVDSTEKPLFKSRSKAKEKKEKEKKGKKAPASTLEKEALLALNAEIDSKLNKKLAQIPGRRHRAKQKVAVKAIQGLTKSFINDLSDPCTMKGIIKDLQNGLSKLAVVAQQAKRAKASKDKDKDKS